jgi:hypothetical protein
MPYSRLHGADGGCCFTREQGRLAVELAACGNFPLAASIITLREARWFSNRLGQTMNRSRISAQYLNV